MTRLPALQQQLICAARREKTRRLRLPAVAAALVVGLGGTGVALAATGVILQTNPSRLTDGAPVVTSVQLLDVRAADPQGGAPWGLRTNRTSSNALCVDVGRVVDGKLGKYQADGSFQEQSVGEGACSSPGARTGATAGPLKITTHAVYLSNGFLPGTPGSGCALEVQRGGVAETVDKLKTTIPAADGAKQPDLATQLAQLQQILAAPPCRSDQLRAVSYGVTNGSVAPYLSVSSTSALNQRATP